MSRHTKFNNIPDSSHDHKTDTNSLTDAQELLLIWFRAAVQEVLSFPVYILALGSRNNSWWRIESESTEDISVGCGETMRRRNSGHILQELAWCVEDVFDDVLGGHCCGWSLWV